VLESAGDGGHLALDGQGVADPLERLLLPPGEPDRGADRGDEQEETREQCNGAAALG
jgi:hypothetical protein